MQRVRVMPVVLSVLATELSLALVGAEINYQAAVHSYSYRGATGLLLRSFGPPFAAPWRAVIWRYSGTSLLLGLAFFLVLLGLAVGTLSRALNGRGALAALFVGIWASEVLTLGVAETARLLIYPGPSRRYEDGTVFALSGGPASVHHAIFFGWVPALVGIVVAAVSDQLAHRSPPA